MTRESPVLRHAARSPSRRPFAVAGLARFAAVGLVAVFAAAVGLFVPAYGQPQQREAAFQTAAAQALLIDQDTGAVLFEKGADELFPPASMTKIMTAAVVFDEIRKGRLKLDDQFHVSEGAWRRGGAPSGMSTMFAAVRSEVRVEDLLLGLLVQAGNDAAIVLAEGISGSEANFGDLMTRRAREIGLTKSTFVNPTGVPDPAQRTTARDLATLSRYIIETYPEFYRYFGEKEFTWNKIRQLNRNPLMALDPNVDGLAAGYSEEDGFGLVGSAQQSGQRLIVVVSGLKTAKDRVNEAKKLLDWGFRSFDVRELFAKGATVGDAKVYGGAAGTVPLVTRSAVRVPFPRGQGDTISARIIYPGPLIAPVAPGQEIGHLVVMRGDVTALNLPLYTGVAVETGSLGQRALDGAIELSTGFIKRSMPSFRKI